MKRAVYLDNFRGFKNTFIPIRDVNFFVGENSTGKSSVLTLLNRMFSDFFWFGLEFNTPDLFMGTFQDLVTQDSADRSYFTIGNYFQDTQVIDKGQAKEQSGQEKKKLVAQGVVVTFRDHNGQISPQEITFYDGKQYIYAEVKDRSIEYTTRKASTRRGLDNDGFLKEMVSFHQSKKKRLIQAELPKKGMRIKGGTPFAIIKIILERNIQRVKQSFDITFESGSSVSCYWLGPIRDEPKRFYDGVRTSFNPNGGHLPYTLNRVIGESKNKKLKSELVNAFKRFGKDSGLFSDIGVRRYGDGQSAPFSLNVTLGKTQFMISNVGYGISQVLPIITQSFINGRSKEGAIFILQQPEVHLHPKAQAALGGYFFDLAKNNNKKFLIETHSDFLIDRFRLEMKRRKKHAVEAQILYFDRGARGNNCHSIPISDEGRLSKNQPAGFQSFFIREQMDILSIG